MERTVNMRRFLLHLIILLFNAFFLAACTNSFPQSNITAGKEKEESIQSGTDSSDADSANTETGDNFRESVSSVSAEPETAQAVWNRTQPEEDTVWDNVLPTKGALALYVYDGASVIQRIVYDKSLRESILEGLLGVVAQVSEDWTPDEQACCPVYILQTNGADGRTTSAAWSNGYWISPNGVAYSFEYDFEELIARTSWEEQAQADSLPGLRFLAEGQTGWFRGMMLPAGELPETLSGISAKAISVEDSILTIALSNTTEESWGYGEYFELQVLLDDIWYQVPLIPDSWGFDDIGLELPPGATQEKSYHLAPYYGTLPAGNYRLISSGLAVEFLME